MHLKSVLCFQLVESFSQLANHITVLLAIGNQSCQSFCLYIASIWRGLSNGVLETKISKSWKGSDLRYWSSVSWIYNPWCVTWNPLWLWCWRLTLNWNWSVFVDWTNLTFKQSLYFYFFLHLQNLLIFYGSISCWFLVFQIQRKESVARRIIEHLWIQEHQVWITSTTPSIL